MTTKAHSVPVINGLGSVLDDTDLVICDIWGVLHDGLTLHPAAVDALMGVKQRGISLVLLTNAPRPRHFTTAQLKDMGAPDPLLENVQTSGGLTRDDLRKNHVGQKLFHLGREEDENLLEDLDIIQVKKAEEADVIVATDWGFADTEEYRSALCPAAEKGVPFICANPDRVVHVGDKLYPCAGAAADRYSEMGGPVVFYGKPEPASYLACLDVAALPHDHDPSRILMIGDSARTDIIGANRLGFRSLLITGGIHRDVFADLMPAEAIASDRIAAALAPHKAMPTYLIDALKP